MEDLGKLSINSLRILGEYMSIPEYELLNKKELVDTINRVILGSQIGGAICTFTANDFTIAVDDSKITITNPFGDVLSYKISDPPKVATFFKSILRSLSKNRPTSLKIRGPSKSTLQFYHDASDEMIYFAISTNPEPGVGFEHVVIISGYEGEFTKFIRCVNDLFDN